MNPPLLVKHSPALGIILGATLFAVSAHAALVFDQPGSNLPGFTSANGSSLTGRAVFDDFMLGSDVQLTRVEWTGGTVSSSSVVDAGSAPPVQFVLTIRPDDGTGRPDTVPLYDLSGGFQTIAGSTLSSSPSEVAYRYGLDLPASVSLDANTRYWLQITALFSGAADALTWDWSAGSGGNGVGFYYDGIANSYVNSFGDQSFTLIGDPAAAVPEPGSLALLTLALAAAGLASSRRRPR